MPAILHSLRVRLGVLLFGVFGLIQIGLFALALSVNERLLRAELDRQVLDQALAAAKALGSAEGDDSSATRPGGRLQSLGAWLLQEGYAQLRGEDGTLLERSGRLKETSLPLSDQARVSATAGRPHLETLTGPGEPLRMVTLYQAQSQAAAPFYMQLAAPLSPLSRAITTLRVAFFWIVPLGLLVTGSAGWWLVRQALAPVGKIARRTRLLNAARLERRIELPGGRDELSDMVVTVNQMLERLELAFKAQDRFIADAAHELKTPVTLLLGQAQVLLQKARTLEEHEQFAASVQDETRHLAQTIESLLVLAKAEAGIPATLLVSLSLNDIVMEAVQRSKAYARQLEVRMVPVLALHQPDGPEPRLDGDPELLCAMVMNLLRNAIRYSPAETVVEVEVEVEASSNGAQAAIAVRDRGPGIPAKEAHRIFERFHRISRRDETFKGTGLGLAIARAVAGLHRGEIAYGARLGGGSEFVVRLPLEDPRKAGTD